MAHVELAASNPTMSHAKYTKSMMQDFEGFDQTDRERILQEVKIILVGLKIYSSLIVLGLRRV